MKYDEYKNMSAEEFIKAIEEREEKFESEMEKTKESDKRIAGLLMALIVVIVFAYAGASFLYL